MIDIVGDLRKVLAWYTLLVYDLEFTTPCWSATSSLLHLNQFYGGGGQGPLGPPPLNTPMNIYMYMDMYTIIHAHHSPNKVTKSKYLNI